MTPIRKWKPILIPGLVALMVGASRAFAQGDEGGGVDFVSGHLHWAPMAATVVYGVIGIVLAMVGIKVYQMISPYDFHKEIEEDQNVALGIITGSMIIGLSIIVAAAIQ
jgi:uncharacterized membrane protein YjfL (UPF0719 family)